MKSILLSFISKKLMAEIAIEIIEALVKSTNTPIDDKAAEPFIDAIKKHFGV